MSDLLIDIANYLIELDNNLTFDEAQEIAFNMNDNEIDLIVNCLN
jgi:hypothetical protein